MITRRRWLEVSLVAGATLALHGCSWTTRGAQTPERLGALQESGGTLIQRTIPSSGEKLPVIGLAFSNHPGCADKTALTQVVKTFADNGGTFIDASLADPANEQFHFTAASELGIASKVFWAARGFVPGPASSPAGVKTQIDSVLAKIKAPRLDIAWVPAAGDPALLAALKEEKKAGRIRYIGVQTIVVKHQAAQLEALMRNEPIDFIGIDYDIGNRFAEETILPLAQERKIGVIAFFPYGNNSGVSCTSMWCGLVVPTRATVTAGWLMTYFPKNCDHVLASKSAAHSGSGRFPTRAKRLRLRLPTTWAAAPAACRTRRHGSAWRR